MDANRKAELIEGIRKADEHLADCRERRATPYLADVMEHWAGTCEIDFDYVAGILRYGQEEDEQNLDRGGLRLMEFQLPDEADPADWWKQQ